MHIPLFICQSFVLQQDGVLNKPSGSISTKGLWKHSGSTSTKDLWNFHLYNMVDVGLYCWKIVNGSVGSYWKNGKIFENGKDRTKYDSFVKIFLGV